MLATERQNQICKMLEESSAVLTASLSETFHVSVETIRKDFLELEKQGLLVRVHGGAIANSSSMRYRRLGTRLDDRLEEKRALSALAARYINEGDHIAVDSGSTALAFADALVERFSDLTVVTHSLDVFQKLAHHKQFHVILCGGEFLKEENAFCGALARRMFQSLHVKKSFIFPSAISLKDGIQDFEPQLYDIQNTLIDICDRVFVLADSGKFEKTALFKLSDMNPQYIYITDVSLPDQIKEVYENHQIKIITK